MRIALRVVASGWTNRVDDQTLGGRLDKGGLLYPLQAPLPLSAYPRQRHECTNARGEQQPATAAQAPSDALVEPPSLRLEPVKPA